MKPVSIQKLTRGLKALCGTKVTDANLKTAHHRDQYTSPPVAVKKILRPHCGSSNCQDHTEATQSWMQTASMYS